MCYNKEISIYTYILGSISSILLLQNKKPSLKILGCFFLIVTQMQLVEFFLWSNNKCNDANIQISTIGSILNFIQPIILYLAIIYYNKNITNEANKYLTIIICVYILVILIYCMNLFPLNCSIVSKKSAPYFQWSWYTKYPAPNYKLIMFPIALTLLLYFGLDKPYNKYLAFLTLISFILSYFIYKHKRAFGTIWCWFAVFIPIGVLLTDKFIISS